MQVQLIVVNEHRKGQVIPVNAPSFVIGRAEGCNLRSRSPQVSRYHCTIQVNNGTVLVQDLGGENGTFVNGNRVASVHTLKDGDKLIVGSHAFTVSVKEGAEKQGADQGESFELTPSSVISPQSDHSDTEAAKPNMQTVVMKPKNPDPEAEVMFEIRLNGQRISASKSKLFELARRGSVLPDDLITVAGTKVFADSIQGIVFGNQSSAPPPQPAPQTNAGTQAPAATPASASEPFAFPDLGGFADEVNSFHAAASEPVVRVARRESAFSAVWKALDISFSRVYTIEGNDLVIHSIKALYYIVVVVCVLGIFWQFFYFIKDCVEQEELLGQLAKHSVGLSVVTFGCITIVVIVRVLLEMLLLAWVESAKQAEQDKKEE